MGKTFKRIRSVASVGILAILQSPVGGFFSVLSSTREVDSLVGHTT